MTLSEICLRRPVLTVVMSVLIVVVGLAALTRIPVRELPNVDTAEVTVSVGYTGAAPAVVDSEITTVIEGAVAGIAGIDIISSEAERGSSRTVITFDTGRDIDAAANDVRAQAMRIWLDPLAMAARDVTVADVTTALADNNVELPAGAIETQSRTLQVRTQTRFGTVQDFDELVVVDRGDTRVFLRDVAEVMIGVEDDESSFRANGTEALGLGVLRQSSSNTVAISEAVRAELEGLQGSSLPEGTTIDVSSDDAVFVRESIAEVVKTLSIAVALVIAVIYVFLASLRATLVPAVTIPIALIGALAGMAFAGFSINILTLFALILSIGLVVDDAIVVLENIQRRIEGGESRLLAAALGTRQVTFAVLATSATLISVFVPLSFLQGEVGRLFTKFGLVLAIAVAVSTFVALTLCPVVAVSVLSDEQDRGRFGRLVDGVLGRITRGYRIILVRAIRAPALVLGLAALISGGAAALYQALPSELTPREDRGVFFVRIDTPQGSNLAYTDEATREVEAILAPYRDEGIVTNLISLVGRYGELNSAFVVVTLSEWGERDKGPQDIITEITPALSQITRATVRANTPGGLGTGGGSSPLRVVINAPSFEQAAEWSGALAERLRENPGLRDVEREYDLNQPGYDIRVDRARARDLGIDARTLSEALQTLFASQEVTEFVDRDQQYPVILQARAPDRASPEDIGRVSLRTTDGQIVPLDGIISVERRASVRAFNRFDRQPAVEVSAGLAEGVDLGAAIEIVETVAADLPDGARIAYEGQSRQFLETSSGVALTFGLSLLVVFLVLAAQFESFVLPAVIMLSVPLAMTGALFSLLLTGQTLNIYSQVGLVLLIGLMAKNGILIVEFANQLRDEGMEVREAIVEGAVVRLRPILMTVISTVLGAVPLVFSAGAGAESRLAIGVVIIGGFASASVLTLFLTPVLYDLVARFVPPTGAVSKRLTEALVARQEPAPEARGS